jgi:hypothetical protein
MLEFVKDMPREHKLAWAVAMIADAIQIVLFPFFFEGALSPVNDILDLIVAGILWRLLGWHWSLLPGFAVKLLPGVDLLPTWTATVFFLTRHQVRAKGPEILPPGPAPEPRR